MHNARERQVPCAACSLSCRNVGAALLHGPQAGFGARSKRKTYTMGPRHLPHTRNCAAWVLTNTHPGVFRQTCIMSERPESIGPNRPT